MLPGVCSALKPFTLVATQCALGDFTSNVHSKWIESTSAQSTSRGGLKWIEHLCAYGTAPNRNPCDVSFIGLSVCVYLNFKVFGSVMAAGWSNEATKILLTVFDDAHSMMPVLTYGIDVSFLKTASFFLLLFFSPRICFVLSPFCVCKAA